MRTQFPIQLRILGLVLLLLYFAPTGFALPAGAARAKVTSFAVQRSAQTWFPGRGTSTTKRIAASSATATVVISPTTVEAGQTLAISGSNFLAGEAIDLKLVSSGPITRL